MRLTRHLRNPISIIVLGLVALAIVLNVDWHRLWDRIVPEASDPAPAVDTHFAATVVAFEMTQTAFAQLSRVTPTSPPSPQPSGTPVPSPTLTTIPPTDTPLPTPTPTRIPQTSTPPPTPGVRLYSPTPVPIGLPVTSTPVLVAPTVEPVSLTVSSRSEAGEVFRCPVAGQVTITITGGAYNPNGPDAPGWWRTILFVFVGDIVWDDHNEPFSPYSVGSYQLPNNTLESAQAAGIGRSVTVVCNANETLRIVAVDTRGSYQHLNTGEVSVSIHHKPTLG